MSDDPALERALDLLVFAPVGLLLAARDLTPELARRGRQQLGSRLALAKVVGQFSVDRAQKEAARIVERVRAETGRVLAQTGRSGPAGTTPGSRPGSRATAAAPGDEGPPVTAAAMADGDGGQAGVPSAPGSAQLAIPGYDSLSASQVIERLSGLSPAELDEIRAYEVAGRGRRTILTRIDQLQSGTAPGWP